MPTTRTPSKWYNGPGLTVNVGLHAAVRVRLDGIAGIGDLGGEISLLFIVTFQPPLHVINPRPGIRHRNLVGDETAQFIPGKKMSSPSMLTSPKRYRRPSTIGTVMIGARAVVHELDRRRADLRFEITLGDVESLDEIGALLHVRLDVRQDFLLGRETVRAFAR